MAVRRFRVLATLCLLSLWMVPFQGACGQEEVVRDVPGVVQPAVVERVATRLPEAPRIVAIGDLHGDLAATRAALQLAGAIDGEDHWIGGTLTVVQTGDLLDRGDDDRALLDLFEQLKLASSTAGGAFIVLNGNHEVMNSQGNLKYVTDAAQGSFMGIPGLVLEDSAAMGLTPAARARTAAFQPGGPYALLLSRNNEIQVVGSTVFVHGGVLPAHVEYGIDRINDEMSAWLKGEGTMPPMPTVEDTPWWSRHYSDEPDDVDCQLLASTLAAVGADRLVVGHTVQKGGISPACDGGVWRIDTGMSSAYGGGAIEVLEIVGEQVRVVRRQEGAGR